MSIFGELLGDANLWLQFGIVDVAACRVDTVPAGCSGILVGGVIRWWGGTQVVRPAYCHLCPMCSSLILSHFQAGGGLARQFIEDGR